MEKRTKSVSPTRQWAKVPWFILRKECPLDVYEKLVVIYILTRRPCFVGQHTMAKDIGISRNSVQRAIGRLLKKGVIGKSQKENWSVFYFVKARKDWVVTVSVVAETMHLTEAL